MHFLFQTWKYKKLNAEGSKLHGKAKGRPEWQQ
jgi:hypothetical protein